MAHRIHIENSAQSFDCGEASTVLHGMEALGCRGIPVGCRGGGCGICKVRVLDGRYHTEKMSRACVSTQEQDEGYALACRLYAQGELRLQVVGKMARAFGGATANAAYRFSALPVGGAQGNDQEE